jgi:prepilin-type N-terminal cleavage/methylation domain-containing protein/prepilin-type processing-associated H-X9-DG protein
MNIQKRTGDQQALTMIELLVVIMIMSLLAVLLFPAHRRSGDKLVRIHCVNNLKHIGLALADWSQAHGEYPMTFRTNGFDGPSYANQEHMFIYFQSLSNGLSSPKLMTCPADRQRTAAINFSTDFNSSHVSYFAGLNPGDATPMSMLFGDRNLSTGVAPKNGVLEITTNQLPAGAPPSVTWTKELHNQWGNILFADSHVEQLTSAKLRQVLRDSGLATNRLVLP